MSTRRARIKAVTSLPPRRKNADVGDKNKPSVNDNVDKPLKSPKTPRPSVSKPETEKLSPIKFASPLPHEPFFRDDTIPKTPRENVASPIKIPAPLESPKKKIVTPKIAEKVPVITKTPIFKSLVLESPRRIESPAKRNIVSPLILSPKPVVKNTEIKDKLNQANSLLNNVNIENNQSDSNNTAGSRSNVPDDYNVPSVPESITEDVMDGIIPLQASAGSKPIAFLKNEIISENAEVLFDPIVPLPSPSKVRPKLRPVPRLAPLRRSSIQGSASESEDETRRGLLGGVPQPPPPRQRHDSHTSHSTVNSVQHRELNRVRNDSICSNTSQATVQQMVPASPIKEKISKTRRQEMSRRMMAMRRRRETVKRDPLTMYDLIFYNPTTNPIVPDQDEIKAKEANIIEAEKTVESEEEDDPPAEAAPVPQIKLGPNGEIILDEKSLVIKQTDNRKLSSVVRESGWSSGGRYKRAARSAEWSDAETVRFYRALAAIGTDFTLMAPLFPDRNRRDIKLKFKKEEKLNGAQVDRALRTATAWDPASLEIEFKQERESAAKVALMQKEKIKQETKMVRERLRNSREVKVRQSKASKALESTMLPGVAHRKENEAVTADEVIERAIKTKLAQKRKKHDEKPNITEPNSTPDMATLKFISPQKVLPNLTPKSDRVNFSMVPTIPTNIESGSLVVFTVDDPNSPAKKMLQTYIAHSNGKLTPIAIPPTLLNSVVNYMKKGTPKSNLSSCSSPQLTSPSSVASADSRISTPSVIQLNPSPVKRQRQSSFSITQL